MTGKQGILSCLLFAVVLLIFQFQAAAAIQEGATVDPADVGIGARPLGMGKAFVALSDDGSGVFTNPAGLAKAKSWKFMSMNAQLLQTVNYLTIGVAYPFEFGVLGLGYLNAGVSGIPLTSLTGNTVEAYGATDYNASLFVLSYAGELSKFPFFEFAKDIDVGANAKIFLQGFSGSSPSLESGTGFDIDLGMQYRPVDYATFAVCLHNCLPMSAGGKFSWPPVGDRTEVLEESIPIVIRVGGALKLWGYDGMQQAGEQELYLALDLDMYHPEARKPGVWHFGAEWWPVEVLAIRAGVDQSHAATTTGLGVENNLTGGVGLKYRGYTFDYAYHQQGELPENVTHYFSIGYIGEELISKAEEKRMEEIIKPKPVIVPVVKPKPELKTFIDVPPGYWAKEPIEYLATLGILGGYPDGTFRPDKTLTRAELAAILVRARGVEPPRPEEDPFPDVSKDHWAAGYIKSAVTMKLVGGYPDGTFKAFNPVSRAEGVVIIARFAELSPPGEVILSPFSDMPQGHWATPNVYIATEAGLLEYLSGKNFEPRRELTRAEVAEILSKTPWVKEKIRELLEGEEETTETGTVEGQ